MRYKVVEGSESGHCCFDATVVDTEQPRFHYAPEHPQYMKQMGLWICECFEVEEANMICDVLNDDETRKCDG